jgi:1A family penicillin-binding protein
MMSKLLKFFWRIRVEISVLILATATILAFIPVFTYLYFAKDLKTKESIMNRNNTGLVLTDRNDKPFFTFYSAKYREVIPLSSIPKSMQQAVIAAEDKEFYQHPGFSIRGILRSLVLDISKKDTAFGGSTLTQQLVKNSLLTSQKRFLRKYQEVVLAQEIERRYGKNEILEMYLNSVYFGEGAFGIEHAAKVYFGKQAANLTLAESAVLAGILPAPSQYSPLSGKVTLAKERQEYVLSQMRRMGYISSEELIKAKNQKLVYTSERPDINGSGAHFALMVRDWLVNKYGEERISRSGFRVKTTLDITWQKYAEEVVAEQVVHLEPNRVTNGAAVVIDPKNGEVRVLVGSADWYNTSFGKVNVATSTRSPGSSFKPIIYAAALEKRLITAATLLPDSPTTFPGNYKPVDYDRKYRGMVLTRRALANSLNIPAVEVMRRLGVTEGLEMGKRMGLTSLKDPSNYGLSLVLGTAEVKLLELTNAYATFANNGVKHDITNILTIIDKRDTVIYEHKSKEEQVVDPGVAFIISSILSDNSARQEVFGNTLTVSRPAAVKTGTGEDYKDALTMGYTPAVAIGVWVGNNDNKPMDQIAGSLGAAPIWRSLIERFSLGTPVVSFTPPDGVEQRSICRYNGQLASTGTGGVTEYFLAGSEPTRYCVIPKPTDQQLANPSLPQGIDDIRKDLKNLRNRSKPGRGGPDAGQIDEVQRQVQEQINQQVQQMQQIQGQIQPTTTVVLQPTNTP